VSEGAARGGGAARWVFVLVMLAGLGLVWRLNAPGHLSVDSILALREGRFHVRETWNPAIYSWLLGLADSVVRGQALAMGASAALLFGTWALLPGLRPRASWAAVVLGLAVLSLPQVAIYPGIVWKDVWFAEATLAGFVALAFALKATAPAPRYGLLALSALLLAAAGLLRQNGLILAPAAAVAIAWAGASARGWSRSAAVAAGWMVLVGVLAMGLNLVAQPQSSGRLDTASGKGVRIVQTYDLLGAAAAEPLPFAHLDRHDPKLDDLLRAQAKAAYSPERIDTLNGVPTLGVALGKAPADVIQAEWFSLLTTQTGLYLQVRGQNFRQVFETPVIDRCLPVHVGVEGPPKALADLQLPARRSAEDQRLLNYVTWFLDTPAYSHVTYALVALAVGLLLLIRRDPADLAMAALMGGVLAFTASFFVISIACDYRYLYLLDVAAITGVLYLALDPRVGRPKERRRGRH